MDQWQVGGEFILLLLLFLELCWNLFAIPVPRTSIVAPHVTALMANHSLSTIPSQCNTYRLTFCPQSRFRKKSFLTPSSKISRRASFDSSATASPTRAISGTMVPSHRYEYLLNSRMRYADRHPDLGRPQRYSPRDQG